MGVIIWNKCHFIQIEIVSPDLLLITTHCCRSLCLPPLADGIFIPVGFGWVGAPVRIFPGVPSMGSSLPSWPKNLPYDPYIILLGSFHNPLVHGAVDPEVTVWGSLPVKFCYPPSPPPYSTMASTWTNTRLSVLLLLPVPISPWLRCIYYGVIVGGGSDLLLRCFHCLRHPDFETLISSLLLYPPPFSVPHPRT